MVSRDHFVAYLLHQLPDEERNALAERCVTDPDLHAEVQMVEAELLDAYARGLASPEQRSRIEAFLLGSPAQRRKLAFARALNAVMPAAMPATNAGGRAFPWRLAAAAVLIVGLAGATAWLARENARLRSQAAAVPAMTPPRADGVPQSAVYAISLPIDAVRGAGFERRAMLPAGTDVVRLDLELEPGEPARSFSAVVSSLGADPGVVWTAEPILPERRGGADVASIWIPAKVLRPGRCEIKLSAAGRAVGYYNVTIVPQG